MKYRADIDGLRAIAVLAVVLFHLDSSLIPGGFVGVDIFFVISGYLITSVIYKDIEGGVFSYKNFYIKRIKRILPVFSVVIIVTIIVSKFLFLYDDAYVLAKAALSTVFFSSNIYFAKGLDYFSSSADEQPLLHTWSLAVEEQFYFIWPFALFLLLRFVSKGNVKFVMAMVIFASFILAETLARSNIYTSVSYYLLPSRAGEMLIGSYLAVPNLNKKNNSNNLLALFGVALIVGTMFFLDEQSVFPGFWAFIPCLGTALVIANASEKSIVTKVLSTKILVFIGLISYSLYLIHWPILAFTRYYLSVESFDYTIKLKLIIVILMLSIFSWWFIEKPTRKLNFSLKKSVLTFYIIPSFIISTSFYYAKTSDDISKSLVSRYDVGIKLCHNTFDSKCIYGDKSKKSTSLLVGDSHTAHLTQFISDVFSKKSQGITIKSSSSCSVVPIVPFSKIKNFTIRDNCKMLSDIYNSDKYNYKTILFAMKWDDYLLDESADNFMSELKNLTQRGIKVELIAQVPSYKKDVLRAFKFGQHNIRNASYQSANIILKNIASSINGVTYIPLSTLLEGVEEGAADNKPLYRDSHHLNMYGVNYIKKMNKSMKVL